MGLLDDYAAKAAPYLMKQVLTSKEKSLLGDVFFEFKDESEKIFPNLSSGNFSSEEESRCYVLLEEIARKGDVI